MFPRPHFFAFLPTTRAAYLVHISLIRAVGAVGVEAIWGGGAIIMITRFVGIVTVPAFPIALYCLSCTYFVISGS